MTNPDSKRVADWRETNRGRYNRYMRELRTRNPDINLKEDLRKARKRAKAAGRPFDDDEWLAAREARKRKNR
jgi:hypothetical protein